MRFEHPHLLHFLWLLPVLAWILHAAYERRRQKISEFVDMELLSASERHLSRRRHRLKAFLLLAGFGLSIVAWARPQWGYHMQEVKRQGLDIMIAVDVSKSMLTQDVKPNRLERTKLAIKDLIRNLKGDRVGLIAFAGDAFLMCPLTMDYNGFLLSLENLDTNVIPRGGTSLTTAIEEAMKGYEDKAQPYKTVVLVTDGEDQEGDAVKAAQRAREKGVKLFTVGIGTQEGDLIRTPNDQGGMDYLKDAQGNYVKSRLNETLLQQIAYVTSGAYVRSSGAQFGLDYLYEKQLSQIEKHEIEDKMQKKYQERFQWFLAVVLVLFVAEAMVVTWKV